MWFNALIIIVAIGCAVTLLYLRAFLMFPFPSLIVRRLPEGFPPPAATADLYEKAAAELAALGFSSPQWIVIAPEKKTPGAFAMISAVFCHAEKNVLALLHPPHSIAAPNELTTQFVTHLADGRKLTSQVRDIYSEAVADDKHPAQTITGATLAEQWAQHQRWVEGFNTPAAADFGSLETLTEELQEIRGEDARLVSAGKLWRDAQGIARPTLTFALRILRLYWTRPRPKANKANVPLARQLMFATFNEHWLARPLPVRWQWSLLVISSVLFAVLGTVFWDASFALAILVVVILHEGGHYLAMRAFGYKHVQMLALPLFGGVTVGIEQKPSATRRAWMAMMGPLPGIVLGWTLLFFFFANNLAAETSSIAMLVKAAILTMAVVLLLVNYLNLLPIPPLDGAHIVQAMLPPRWLIVRTIFFVVACIIGAAITIYIEFYLLTLLMLWQFLWGLSLLSGDKAVRLLAADASFRNTPPDHQRRRALEALQQCVGETTNMTRRLQQLQSVVTALTQTAMSWRHRTGLATLYLGLLCSPLVLWGLVMMEISSSINYLPSRPDPEKLKETQQRVFLSLGRLEVPQLLAQMPESPLPRARGGWLSGFLNPAPPPLPGPADPRQIAATQNRLGIAFPDDYRDLLSLHDGYPPLRLLPVTQVRHFSETEFFSDEEDVQESQTFYSFAFPPSFEDEDTETVPGQRVWRNEELQNCAVIGGWENTFAAPDQKDAAPAEVFPALLWCPEPTFEQARIVSLGESLWAPDFTTYLRYKVTQRIAAQELADSDEAP
jgi:Zn-dependent protease